MDLIRRRAHAVVVRGRQHQHSGADYVADFSDAADLAGVLRTIGSRFPRIDAIVMFAPASAAPEEDDGVVSEVERLCAIARNLLRAVATAADAIRPRVWMVTAGAQAIVEADGVAGLAQGALWGLGRTAAVERPETRCTLIDIAEPGASADAVAREILSDSTETQVALRGAERFVARVAPARFAPARRAAGAQQGQPLTVRDDATYLVTGGHGALGQIVTRWLVKRGARHVLLAGRHAPPDSVRAMIDDLRGVSARIESVPLDVADLAAVRDLLARLPEGMPAVQGVFHLAGVLRDGVLADQPWDAFREAFPAKVAGAWNLHRAVRDRPLDFFVCFSSLAATIGNPGQSAYSAANAFLDALAHYRAAKGRPATAIAWGGWAGAGMAAAVAPLARRRGIELLQPDDAVAALDQIFENPVPHIVVAPVAAAHFADVPGTLFELEDAARGPIRAPDKAFAAVFRSTDRSRRRGVVEELAVAEVRRVLGLGASDRVHLSQSFREIGFDSLMSLDLRNRLMKRTERPLPATLLFDHPTVGELVDALLGWLGDASAPEPVEADDLDRLPAESIAELLRIELEHRS